MNLNFEPENYFEPENGVYDTKELSIDMYEICRNRTKECTVCHNEMWLVMFLPENFMRDYNPASMTRVYKTCQHCRDRAAMYRNRQNGIEPEIVPDIEEPEIVPDIEEPQIVPNIEEPEPPIRRRVFVLHV